MKLAKVIILALLIFGVVVASGSMLTTTFPVLKDDSRSRWFHGEINSVMHGNHRYEVVVIEYTGEGVSTSMLHSPECHCQQ